MTTSKDRVKPSPKPDSWKLNEIFATGIVTGTYLALVTVLFYWVISRTDFFDVCHDFFLNKIKIFPHVIDHGNDFLSNMKFLMNFLATSIVFCDRLTLM